MARYDTRYDARYGPPRPPSSWYPGAFWAAPMAGWAGWAGVGGWGWPPYGPGVYGPRPRDLPRRPRPPRESPTYGRAGDRAARRFAEGHGYDAGLALRPHPRRGMPPPPPGRRRR